MPPLSPADFVRGDRQAPVVLVHYGDFECPFSGALHGVLRELETRFGDQLAVAFRQFPLSDIHPHAWPAALAAQAAGEHFWAMHDQLFENQDDLCESELLRFAETLGLESAGFRAAFSTPETRQAVEKSVAAAQNIGIRGTPSLFINGEGTTTTRDYGKCRVCSRSWKPLCILKTHYESSFDWPVRSRRPASGRGVSRQI